jgi:hypothetical protein
MNLHAQPSCTSQLSPKDTHTHIHHTYTHTRTPAQVHSQRRSTTPSIDMPTPYPVASPAPPGLPSNPRVLLVLMTTTAGSVISIVACQF